MRPAQRTTLSKQTIFLNHCLSTYDLAARADAESIDIATLPFITIRAFALAEQGTATQSDLSTTFDLELGTLIGPRTDVFVDIAIPFELHDFGSTRIDLLASTEKRPADSAEASKGYTRQARLPWELASMFESKGECGIYHAPITELFDVFYCRAACLLLVCLLALVARRTDGLLLQQVLFVDHDPSGALLFPDMAVHRAEDAKLVVPHVDDGQALAGAVAVRVRLPRAAYAVEIRRIWDRFAGHVAFLLWLSRPAGTHARRARLPRMFANKLAIASSIFFRLKEVDRSTTLTIRCSCAMLEKEFDEDPFGYGA